MPPSNIGGGKSLDRVPGIAATPSWDHRWEMKDGGRIKFGVNSKISGGYWLSDLAGTGSPLPVPVYTSYPMQYRQGTYTRSDVTLGYTMPNGKMMIEGNVRNLENGVQLQNAPTTAQPGRNSDRQFVRVNLPRTIGARLSVNYWARDIICPSLLLPEFRRRHGVASEKATPFYQTSPSPPSIR